MIDKKRYIDRLNNQITTWETEIAFLEKQRSLVKEEQAAAFEEMLRVTEAKRELAKTKLKQLRRATGKRLEELLAEIERLVGKVIS